MRKPNDKLGVPAVDVSVPGDRELAIYMEGARQVRFNRTLLELSDAVESLTTAIQHFPLPQCGPGEMEPRVTVQAFVSHMDNLLGLLQAMTNNEEHLNEEHREDDHAQG